MSLWPVSAFLLYWSGSLPAGARMQRHRPACANQCPMQRSGTRSVGRQSPSCAQAIASSPADVAGPGVARPWPEGCLRLGGWVVAVAAFSIGVPRLPAIGLTAQPCCDLPRYPTCAAWAVFYRLGEFACGGLSPNAGFRQAGQLNDCLDFQTRVWDLRCGHCLPVLTAAID